MAISVYRLRFLAEFIPSAVRDLNDGPGSCPDIFGIKLLVF